jgi:hypothetical protein
MEVNSWGGLRYKTYKKTDFGNDITNKNDKKIWEKCLFNHLKHSDYYMYHPI